MKHKKLSENGGIFRLIISRASESIRTNWKKNGKNKAKT